MHHHQSIKKELSVCCRRRCRWRCVSLSLSLSLCAAVVVVWGDTLRTPPSVRSESPRENRQHVHMSTLAQPPWHLLSACSSISSLGGSSGWSRDLLIGVAYLRSASVSFCPVLSCPALSWQISSGNVSLATALALAAVAAKVVRFYASMPRRAPHVQNYCCSCSCIFLLLTKKIWLFFRSRMMVMSPSSCTTSLPSLRFSTARAAGRGHR